MIFFYQHARSRRMISKGYAMFLQTYLVSRRKKALVLMPGLKDLAPSLDIQVAARIDCKHLCG